MNITYNKPALAKKLVTSNTRTKKNPKSENIIDALPLIRNKALKVTSYTRTKTLLDCEP